MYFLDKVFHDAPWTPLITTDSIYLHGRSDFRQSGQAHEGKLF